MKHRFLISVLFLLVSSTSFAWNRVGNGGGAWICRSYVGSFSNTEVSWVAQIDLHEASSQYGLKIKNFSGNYRSIVKKVAQRLSALPNNPLAGLAPFLKEVNDLRPGQHVTYVDHDLNIINDALYFAVPKASACPKGRIRYEQIVNFDNNGFIFVQKSLFNHLSERSKAAMVLHEAIYAYRRSLGDTDSLNSRRIVGLAFSTLPDEEISWHLSYLKNDIALRYPPSYNFYIKMISDEGQIQPLWSIPIRLTGLTKGASTENAALEVVSNYLGFAFMYVDPIINPIKAAPNLSIRLNDGNTYTAPLTPNGWAKRLSPNLFSTNPKYSCEAVTMVGYNDVHIICVSLPKN
ncbi:hypothetical protein DOM22_12120 [Bdellovibrio sp. ZAP7]|uniref:hypothetical protein n=1 Tax=Bdellovibrio sp. ZAP7 TaxID=2231053 RepID=UPI00115A1448|nr:hypothetical protein [Bdellovibrio sp. ZAP7]QDK45843.1 hypothetical protein DOM22_12120 [Bdellovibrio sp. ZAP7]